MTHKQTIISSAIAIDVFNVKDSYFIFKQKMESGSYKSNFGSKGQRSTSWRLSGCTYFVAGFLNIYLGQFFFLLCTQIQDDERNMPKKF